ncbi:MAG TPA: hypothetical protein DCY48_03935 [Candidatus Magasanikbacteria bacterium]|nr:MAG: hypothetical protein A3I74_04990 [Candidatus Magasanikbacteria bacterium RIFCSPLOWO2_02_FULL_47_16]OGH79766.1 MAG: hypothetical protein A3C10_04140 [Candidatus Magasanikbacteria bacterium RIFCSPHIGHO2_02_FULL_48_18]OGH82553.1 MAG: hypothetical protein A3G08_03825 [Candidatus Magasanikbacteria bacterium RIFCSPLOWO2_12_FULL_47_9b]HAZ28895.1 hypothetical protein [Candidatus Magasanikbacteria bacterium]
MPETTEDQTHLLVEAAAQEEGEEEGATLEEEIPDHEAPLKEAVVFLERGLHDITSVTEEERQAFQILLDRTEEEQLPPEVRKRYAEQIQMMLDQFTSLSSKYKEELEHFVEGMVGSKYGTQDFFQFANQERVARTKYAASADIEKHTRPFVERLDTLEDQEHHIDEELRTLELQEGTLRQMADFRRSLMKEILRNDVLETEQYDALSKRVADRLKRESSEWAAYEEEGVDAFQDDLVNQPRFPEASRIVFLDADRLSEEEKATLLGAKHVEEIINIRDAYNLPCTTDEELSHIQRAVKAGGFYTQDGHFMSERSLVYVTGNQPTKKERMRGLAKDGSLPYNYGLLVHELRHATQSRVSRGVLGKSRDQAVTALVEAQAMHSAPFVDTIDARRTLKGRQYGIDEPMADQACTVIETLNAMGFSQTDIAIFLHGTDKKYDVLKDQYGGIQRRIKTVMKERGIGYGDLERRKERQKRRHRIGRLEAKAITQEEYMALADPEQVRQIGARVKPDVEARLLDGTPIIPIFSKEEEPLIDIELVIFPNDSDHPYTLEEHVGYAMRLDAEGSPLFRPIRQYLEDGAVKEENIERDEPFDEQEVLAVLSERAGEGRLGFGVDCIVNHPGYDAFEKKMVAAGNRSSTHPSP